MPAHSLSKENLSLLFDVAKKINSSLELEELLKQIMETAKEFFNSEASSLLLIDKKSNELYFNKATGAYDAIAEIRVPMGKGVAGIVAQTGKPTIVNDQDDDRIYKEVDKATTMVTRNLVAVPLKVKDTIIGVLEIMNSIGREDFNEEDLEMLSVFSDFAALAINNRELLDHARTRVKQLAAIYSLSQVVNRTDTRDLLLRQTLEIIEENLGAQRISIILKDQSSKGFKFITGKGFTKQVLKKGPVTTSDNILSYILKNKKGVLCFNIKHDPRFGKLKKLRYQTNSFIATPLFSPTGQSIIGFVCATETDKPHFKPVDLEFLETIAKEFAEGYNIISLKEEVKQKNMLEAEVKITARMQDEILPTSFPDIPRTSIATASIPCKTVGGDFYDIIPRSKNEFVAMISDISGKGIPSTVFMSVCRTVLRMSLNEKSGIRNVITSANKSIYDNSRSGMFATAFMASINSKSKKITYTNAGHFEQYLFCHKTKKLTTLAGKSRPLGVFPDTKFQEKSVPYGNRDILFLFTDGILEAINKKGEYFGAERLKEIILGSYQLTAEEIKDTITEEVKKFSRSKELDDDLTLVVIKFT